MAPLREPSCLQVGAWEPHGELAQGALEGSLGSTSVAGLLGGPLCILTERNVEHHAAGCLHPQNILTRGCILQGSCWTMQTQSQGCWCPGPCSAPPMCGALRAAGMMAPPASMALGTAQHGHDPSVGTKDGDQTSRARGCLAQPQPSPEVPNSCPGVPLCQVCVLRGALPARPPS